VHPLSWEHTGYCRDVILGFVVLSDAAHQPGGKETSNKKLWRQMDEDKDEANGCCSLILYARDFPSSSPAITKDSLPLVRMMR
jgi:hypothetical protein